MKLSEANAGITFLDGVIEGEPQPRFPKMAEPKFDGYRAYSITDVSGNTFLHSKNHKYYREKFPRISHAIESLPHGYFYDGEIVGDTFEDVARAARTGDDSKLHFRLFDMLSLSEWLNQRSDHSQLARSLKCHELVKAANNPIIKKVDHVIVKSLEEMGTEFFQQRRRFGREGLVLKDLDARYSFRPSTAWQKVKEYFSYDAQISRIETDGTLKVFIAVDGVETGIGVTNRQRNIIREASVGDWIEFKALQQNASGKFRNPNFLRMRPDIERE